MKQPHQAIVFAGLDNQAAVQSGDKTSTYRDGHRAYRVGERVLLGCPFLGWASGAEITSVAHYASPYDVPSDLLRQDGYDGPSHLIVTMQRYYPDFSADSPCTRAEWHLDLPGV